MVRTGPDLARDLARRDKTQTQEARTQDGESENHSCVPRPTGPQAFGTIPRRNGDVEEYSR